MCLYTSIHTQLLIQCVCECAFSPFLYIYIYLRRRNRSQSTAIVQPRARTKPAGYRRLTELRVLRRVLRLLKIFLAAYVLSLFIQLSGWRYSLSSISLIKRFSFQCFSLSRDSAFCTKRFIIYIYIAVKGKLTRQQLLYGNNNNSIGPTFTNGWSSSRLCNHLSAPWRWTPDRKTPLCTGWAACHSHPTCHSIFRWQWSCREPMALQRRAVNGIRMRNQIQAVLHLIQLLNTTHTSQDR